MDYIELIHKILKPGGHWINLGPLLYHFADIPREPSIEPPYEIGNWISIYPPENSGKALMRVV